MILDMDFHLHLFSFKSQMVPCYAITLCSRSSHNTIQDLYFSILCTTEFRTIPSTIHIGRKPRLKLYNRIQYFQQQSWAVPTATHEQWPGYVQMDQSHCQPSRRKGKIPQNQNLPTCGRESYIQQVCTDSRMLFYSISI